MSAWLWVTAPTASKNIVTDYGAVADGVTDCTTAFTNFRTFARTQTGLVSLTIPAGSYAINTGSNFAPFSGIDNLVISGYGATLIFSSTMYVTGRCGYQQLVNTSARVQTVTAGDQVATLVTPADASIFEVGDWCSLGALEWQGVDGYPPNLHFNEFVKIADISDGVISFTTTVTQDYSSLYPASSAYPAAPSTVYDPGGPATLYLMGSTFDPSDSWDTQVAVYGVTFNNTGGSGSHQVYGPGRSVTYVDCTFTLCSPIPSANKFFSATGIVCTSEQIEVDKNVEYAEFIGCTLRQLFFQSSSVNQTVVDSCSFTLAIQGTPRKLLIKGASSVPTLGCGAGGYGATEEIIIQSPAVISALTVNDSNRSAYSNFTQSGGNLTYAGSVGHPLPFGVPGGLLVLATSTRKWVYGSTVSAVTDSSHNAVLHTDFANPLPTLPATYGTPNYVKQHPCLSMTVESGVTGCPQILALVGATAAGAPLFSVLDYTSDWTTGSTFQIRGQLVSMTIDVTTAYTGAQSTAIYHFGGVFDNTSILLADGTASTYGPKVNTKIVGTRVITPTSVTGAQTGDTLGAAPGLISFVDFGGITPKLVGSFGGDTAPQMPSVHVTVLLDQAP